MASASSVAGQREGQMMKEYLNCSVCLDTYKSPRLLACFHTFCEQCIDSIIRRHADQWVLTRKLECPVCRKETPAPGLNTAPEDWAKELGINYAIISLQESMTIESGSGRQCGPCVAMEKSQVADHVCLDCREYQCASCAQFHSSFLATQQHKVVTIEEVSNLSIQSSLNLGNVEYCMVHNDKAVEFYCEDHDALCCSSCAIVGHRKCGRVAEVTSLGSYVREAGKPQRLQESMKVMLMKLVDIAKVIKANVTSLDQNAASMKQNVRNVRAEVLQEMDRLVGQVDADCDQLKNEHSTHLQQQISEQESHLAAVTSSNAVLESTIQHGSESQLFIAYHMIKQQVVQYKKMLRDVEENTAIVELHLDVDSAIEAIAKPANRLAEVNVSQTKADLKRYVAQIAERKLEKGSLVCIQKMANSQPPCFEGVVFLPDGRLVAVDSWNDQCCLIDDSGSVTASIKLPSHPRCLAVIGDLEVVVVMQKRKQLQRVSVGAGTLTLSGHIRCHRTPRCIARVSENQLAVGWADGFGIISPDGEETLYLQKDTSGRALRFAPHDRIAVDPVKTQVYQTVTGSDAVYCFALDGEPYFCYMNRRLTRPKGVALDRNGIIYVCSYGNGTVHQLAPEGHPLSVIDTCMDAPKTICINSTGEEMVAINVNAHSLLMFSARFVTEG